MSQDESKEKIQFKRKKHAFSGRKRSEVNDEHSAQEDDDDNSGDWNKLDELRELQRLKKRTNKGMNVNDLCSIRTDAKKDDGKNEGSVGGLTDAKTLSSELDLGNTFSVETNRRDEDTDMMRFIEEELQKRQEEVHKRQDVRETIGDALKNKDRVKNILTEDGLFDVLPNHLLKATSVKKNEEMLSNQMLNGIPEVELGIEERIRNIEATEEAKMRLMESKKNKTTSTTSTFVPTNIAVCFVHHNRFNIEEDVPHLNTKRQRHEPEQRHNHPSVVEEPVVVIGDEPKSSKIKIQPKGSGNQNKFPGKEKATDDYIFEKFKKQFKKY